MDEDAVWSPLRTYQSKLDKMVQKAAAEQANAIKKAEAAAQAEENRMEDEQDKRDDVVIDAAADDEAERAPEKISGKKRQAEDIDDDGDGEGEEEGDRYDAIGVENSGREGSSDAENAHVEQRHMSRGGSVNETYDGPAMKEIKRIRVN